MLIVTAPVAAETPTPVPETADVTPAFVSVTEEPSATVPPPDKPEPAATVTELLASPAFGSAADSPAAVPVVFWFNVGMSAAAIARKAGCALAPDVGPAKNVFCVCALSVIVRLPFVVNGELLTV